MFEELEQAYPDVSVGTPSADDEQAVNEQVVSSAPQAGGQAASGDEMLDLDDATQVIE